MSKYVTDSTFRFFSHCQRYSLWVIIGKSGVRRTGSLQQIGLGCWMLCSAELDEELACALIPVVPKESRRCWAQVFCWPAAGGWKDQPGQLRGVFCRGAGSTTLLPMTARGKFGNLLCEQSGLLFTMTCFGIEKGGSSNFCSGVVEK